MDEYFEAVAALVMYGLLQMAKRRGKDFNLLIDDAWRFERNYSTYQALSRWTQ